MPLKTPAHFVPFAAHPDTQTSRVIPVDVKVYVAALIKLSEFGSVGVR